MKKILFATLFIGSTFLSSAQTQIPNGDFENWTNHQECVGMDSLVNFFNLQEMLYLDAKSRFGTGLCPTVPTQYKTTDKQSGNYALILGPQYIDDEIYYNYVTLGPAKDFGSNVGISSEGIPFTGRPTKLTGYYKFTNGVVGDELNILVLGSNLTAQDYLFYGHFNTSINETAYKKFEIDLVYDLTDANNAMMLNLIITVGNAEDGSINENTVALIDNLVFEYTTTTSTTNFSATSPINVYAANKNINFSENVSDIHVVDMVGAQKISEITNTKTINTASLTAGMYIVTYKYNDAYFSKKVIIE